MTDTQSHTESLLDIVKGIDRKTIMLPEFQRDFRWELDKTYDLFDSLVRDVFIGTIIYGKPAFEMTLREMDRRPRKHKRSSAALPTEHYTRSDIQKKVQTENFRIVLDGQQRLTAIYRAITGIDSVYLVLRTNLDASTISNLSLEEMFDIVSGEESKIAVSVRLSDAYEFEVNNLEDEELNERFALTQFARKLRTSGAEREFNQAQKTYRRAVRRLADLYKQSKMVAFYLLDMSLDKFTLFFERSNSRGIQLNFTDILAAKLYHGFNLRNKIEEFESQSKFTLNREIIVRAIAYIAAVDRSGPISIDKTSILKNLDAHDFQRYWDTVCKLYTDSLNYLAQQHYILSQDWMPSENMIIPLMIFLRQLKSFDRMSEDQRQFIEYWYWASVFAIRYSASSNEVIILDCRALTQVALGQSITGRAYFTGMRPLIAEPEDLFSYTKKSSLIYRGVLNLLGYSARGLKNWNNTQTIDVSMSLEDHQIYPRAYIRSGPEMADLSRDEAEQLLDCVVNRTLIPKVLNVQIGKKAPSEYLSDLQKYKNPNLAECLPSHLVPIEMISEHTWNSLFGMFLQDRANAIFRVIKKYAVEPATTMTERYSAAGEEQETAINALGKARLKDMIASGRLLAGERVFTRKQPNKFATIVDGETVEFNGQRVLINTWGQQMTGWSTINIYDSVILERTGQVWFYRS